MGRKSISQAKNDIKTCFKEIIDPSPSGPEIARMWSHFASCCAYCGSPLRRDKREGHADHLVSKFAGGLNHISNRVLSCGGCNGDDKRESDWERFILTKGDEQQTQGRIKTIQNWTGSMHPSEEELTRRLDLIANSLADRLAGEVCDLLEGNAAKLKESIQSDRHTK